MALRTDLLRFRALSPIATFASLAAVATVLAACGGSNSKYLIPVDAPEYKPFEAPEDEAFEDQDWDEGDDDDDDGDSNGEDETEGEGDAKTTPATGTSGGGGAAKPAGGAVKADLKLGKSTVTGSLDKNIIRRYIRRHVSRVRHCYEKELITNPTLSGRVSVTFVITPTGSVKDVAASGLAVVDACVGKAMASIAFPKPKGGGTVRVRYPFVFSTK